jgi:hypothetical protein
MKVTNAWNVPNQFIINTPEATFFQSYKSIIVKRDFDDDNKPRVTLDETYWNYSKTTRKYRNLFLGLTSKEIEANIKSGKFLLANLNKD